MSPADLSALAERISDHHQGSRTLVAIAGPPGSGKSHLADALVAELNRGRPGRAAILPMDGFHFDDGLLKELGRLSRKGAPDTFDVDGLRHMLSRLKANADRTVIVPVFDRDIEIARAGARAIEQSVEIIIVEGNYLLLRRDPWSSLARSFDLTILLDVPLAVLRQRLEARWRSYELPAAEIRRKVEEVDIPNGQVVMNESRQADLLISG